MTKKIVLMLAMGFMLTATTASAQMTKKGKTYTVNTTTLCNARGFKGTTPLLVTFKSGKITSLEALPNHDTPQYFKKASAGLFAKYKGMKATKAATQQVDGVTGATYSSKGIKANVQAAAKYYNAHK